MNRTYKAVQVTKPGQLEVVDRAIVEPAFGQVRIRVEACGVCHTDAYTVEGGFPGLTLPRVPGHEVTGETLRQVAEEISQSTTCALPPKLFSQRLDDLHLRITASKQLRLEDELEELLLVEPGSRNRKLVATYLGLDGRGAHALEVVGSQYGMKTCEK